MRPLTSIEKLESVLESSNYSQVLNTYVLNDSGIDSVDSKNHAIITKPW